MRPTTILSILLLLCFAITALIAQTVNSEGGHNQNIGINNGSAIQVTIQAPPTVRKQLQARAPDKKDWANLILPGKVTSPPDIPSCIGHVEKRDLRVFLGTVGEEICTQDICRIITAANVPSKNYGGISEQQPNQGSDLLTVTREGTSMRIHVELYGADGRIQAAIEDDNRFVINPNDTFEFRHPDSHTLKVVDEHYATVLSISFLNPTTLYVLGTFHDRYGRVFHVSKSATEPVNNYGLIITGMCSKNIGVARF